MKFKMCWVSHEKIYLENVLGKRFTLERNELLKILGKVKLKSTKQIKNYKLELI